LLQPEKGKRREVKQVLVNVRPCNVKAVQRGMGGSGNPSIAGKLVVVLDGCKK
jgi:hypothetical protein